MILFDFKKCTQGKTVDCGLHLCPTFCMFSTLIVVQGIDIKEDRMVGR